jgi:type III pantothenate kinase
MYICIDLGNTQLFGGFYEQGVFRHSLRLNTKMGWSSDQIGLALCAFCREKGIDPKQVDRVVVSSVVPSMDHHLRNAFLKYFQKDPLFVRGDTHTGLSFERYKSQHEIGSDLIASAVGAVQLYGEQPFLIIDMGTATTVVAINDKKEFITGVILPGIKTQADALAQNAEKLFGVEIVEMESIMCDSTIESIQAGLYYGPLGAVKEICKALQQEALEGKACKVIGTGGYARLFQKKGLYDIFDADLILKGLVAILEMNKAMD